MHLQLLRSRRGAGIIDVVVTLFLLGVAGLMFSAMFPTSISASREAQEYKLAAATAQRKMEQVRAMNFESLTQPLLSAAGVIDPDDTTSPYSFTSVDSVSSLVANGSGELAISSIASDIKQVQITVSWDGPPGGADRSVRLTTTVADRRARRMN